METKDKNLLMLCYAAFIIGAVLCTIGGSAEIDALLWSGMTLILVVLGVSCWKMFSVYR